MIEPHAAAPQKTMSDDDQKLTQMTERIEETAEDADGSPTIGDVLAATGSQSIGPVLFAPALIALSPIGGVPLVPTTMGIVIMLFAVQLLAGRRELWLPDFIARRELPADKVEGAARRLEKVMRPIDRRLGVRWTWATGRTGAIVVGVLSILLAASMIPLEAVPFAVFAPSLAITALAAGLTTNDGVLVVAGVVISSATVVLLVKLAAGWL